MEINNLKPINEIERKILNIRYEWINGLIERSKLLMEELDYNIKTNERIKEINHPLLLSLRKYSEEQNLDLLEDLIRLKDVSFRVMKELRFQIRDASKL